MAEKDHLILTAIGPDRVGLVESISKFLSARHCNIEDSKMAVFCGEFAVIILISGPAAGLASVAKDYRAIETETGLTIAVRAPASRTAGEMLRPYRLTASCMDHPGVVYQISGILSSAGINIESMETKTYSAPVSGTPLFRLEAILSVPARTSLNQVRDSMAEIQREQNIDIELTAVTP